jgi:hypothetical protein
MDIEGKTVEELHELNRGRLVRMHDIPEYKVWSDMKYRCNNPNYSQYRDWGGRGISVCPEWNKDFWAWFEHIGRRRVDGLTQERIDNSKGYQPGNVRWDTRRAQSNNQRPPIIPWGKTSRYRGVSWHPKVNKWQVELRVNGVPMSLGYFANETDAAICWNYHVAYYGLDKPLNTIEAADYIHD